MIDPSEDSDLLEGSSSQAFAFCDGAEINAPGWYACHKWNFMNRTEEPFFPPKSYNVLALKKKDPFTGQLVSENMMHSWNGAGQMAVHCHARCTETAGVCPGGNM